MSLELVECECQNPRCRSRFKITKNTTQKYWNKVKNDGLNSFFKKDKDYEATE